MILEECKEVFNRSFAQLEKENLSDSGIAAICDIRKAVKEVLMHASNYQDALMLFNRLSNSVVREQSENDVLANPFWDMQEKNRNSMPVVEEKAAAPIPSQMTISEEPVEKRPSVRGSGRLSSVSRVTEPDVPCEVIKPQSDRDFDKAIEDAVQKFDEALKESTEKSFEGNFKERFETDFSDAFKGSTDITPSDDVQEYEDYTEGAGVYFDTNPFIQEEDIDEGIFSTDVYEAEDLPEYAVSMMDDPYLLADDLIESLDEDEMELFMQLGQDEELSDDIFRPSDVVESEPIAEPVEEDVKEAVESARDKFYMPARSRIAMIRGVEPEDSFSGIDLLADGYTGPEDTVEPEYMVPTEDELRNAEDSWDEDEAPGVAFERVEAPEGEEDDEEYPIFDADQYGIPVEQPVLMSDEEYEEQHKIDMTTTIAEQAAQAEQYWDKFSQASMIGFSDGDISRDIEGDIEGSEEE